MNGKLLELVASVRSKNKDPRLNFYPDIPPTLLSKVLATYGQAAKTQGETVLAILDNASSERNEAVGLALTEKFIYWHNGGQVNGLFPLAAIQAITCQDEATPKSIQINGEWKILTGNVTTESLVNVIEMVNKIRTDSFCEIDSHGALHQATSTLPPLIVQPLPSNVSSTRGSGGTSARTKLVFGCMGAIILLFLAFFAAALLLEDADSPVTVEPSSASEGMGRPPKTMRIPADPLCFKEWRDLDEFWTKSYQFMERQMGGRGLLDISSAEAAEIGKQLNLENQRLKREFSADGRCWNIPEGTEIKIRKFYDRQGNEITPVLNTSQNTFYTSDGKGVYVEGEWGGKSVYTYLPDGKSGSQPTGDKPSANSSSITKDQWKMKLAKNHNIFAFAGQIQMYKDDFIKLMGSPAKTQTIQGKVYWYYNCTDGIIEVEATDTNLRVGMLVGRVNDY